MVVRFSIILIYLLLAVLSANSQTAILRHTIENSYGVLSVKFSPDGKTLACVGDHVFKLFDVKTGHILRTFEPDYDSMIESVAYSPNGKFLAISYGNTLKILDVRSGKVHKTISVHSHTTNKTSHDYRSTSVKFSPDNKRIVTVSGGFEALEGPIYGEVKLWDVKTGKLALELASENEFIWDVDFSPNGYWLASGSANGVARVWDLQTKKPVAVLSQNEGAINSLTFTANGIKLIISGEDKLVRVWNTQGWKLDRQLEGHTDRVLSVVVYQDKIISAGSGDHTIRIWEMGTGKTACVIKADEYWNAVAISPDGKTIAAGSADGTVMLWEIK